MWRFTCPCVCGEANILFPIAHPPSFLKPGAFSQSGWPVCALQTGVHGVPGLHHHACFCTGTWNSNSGSHACAADTLPTELPPSLSLICNFQKSAKSVQRMLYTALSRLQGFHVLRLTKLCAVWCVHCIPSKGKSVLKVRNDLT